MNVKDINEAVAAAIAERGCFPVETIVSKDNDILLTIESENGFVTLEDCEYINDVFVEKFDRDAEDYSLTVSSAGLDRPFKVEAQFRKAVGSKVEVAFKGGRKLVALLEAADSEGITLFWKALTAEEGQKKKVMKDFTETFPFNDINTVTPYIEFE